jgi:hypothetical protein
MSGVPHGSEPSSADRPTEPTESAESTTDDGARAAPPEPDEGVVATSSDFLAHNYDDERAYVVRVVPRAPRAGEDAPPAADGTARAAVAVYHVPPGRTVAGTELLRPGRYEVRVEATDGARDDAACRVAGDERVLVEVGNGVVDVTHE